MKLHNNQNVLDRTHLTVAYHTALYYSVLHYIELCYPLRCYTLPSYVELYHIVLNDIASCCTVLNYNILKCTAWYRNVLYVQALAFIGNKVRQVRANNVNTKVSYRKNSSPEAEVRNESVTLCRAELCVLSIAISITN